MPTPLDRGHSKVRVQLSMRWELVSMRWELAPAPAAPDRYARRVGDPAPAISQAAARSGALDDGGWPVRAIGEPEEDTLLPRPAEKLETRRQPIATGVPIGTVTAGKPVLGLKSRLLSPCGVFRSPIVRGGLLDVGFTRHRAGAGPSPREPRSEAGRERRRSSCSPGLIGIAVGNAWPALRLPSIVGWNLPDLMILSRPFTGTRLPWLANHAFRSRLNGKQFPSAAFSMIPGYRW